MSRATTARGNRPTAAEARKALAAHIRRYLRDYEPDAWATAEYASVAVWSRESGEDMVMALGPHWRRHAARLDRWAERHEVNG